MRSLACVIAAALLAACGQPTDEGPQMPAGKGDLADDGRVIWSDGEHSVGAYQYAWGDRLAPRYVEELVEAGELPALPVAAATEYYYSVDASHYYEPDGHLAFYLHPETRAMRLQGDAMMVKVNAELKAGRPASAYDLALLKFNHVNGREGYTSIVVRLDEAMAGRVVTQRDEAAHAPGMLASLQGEGNGPDRIGFSGTWKAIVVPRDRAPSAAVRRYGTPEVALQSIRVLAAPTPAPAPSEPLPADLRVTHAWVMDALAARDYDALAELVHPDCGVFELYNFGVTTAVLSHERLSDEVAAMRYGVFDGARCDVIEHTTELPYFSCEAEAYSKTGCFATPLSDYHQLTMLQGFIDEWVTLEPSAPEHMEQLRRCESAVRVAVSSAQGYNGFTLGYGLFDGQWKLVVVDHVVPCDA